MAKRRHALGVVKVIDGAVDPDAIAAINEDFDNLHRNIQNENIRPGIEATKIRHHFAKDAVIGTTETPVGHSLGVVPLKWTTIPKADARIWQAKEPDQQQIYLIANVAVTADIIIEG